MRKESYFQICKYNWKTMNEKEELKKIKEKKK